MSELEIEAIQVSRTKREGVISYDEVTPALIRESRLIVNTTPLGMYPDTDACAPIPYEHIGKDHLLFDLIYNPELTVFMKKGLERGARAVNGSDMLKYQAEASWEIWNR